MELSPAPLAIDKSISFGLNIKLLMWIPQLNPDNKQRVLDGTWASFIISLFWIPAMANK